MNMINALIDYETGELNNTNTIKLFSHLIRKDLIQGLQGHYGRTAEDLIQQGYINDKGKILKEVN